MKLTDQLSQLNKRVGALESEGFNDASTIARISKIYGGVRVTMTIRAWLHTYMKVGQTEVFYPSPGFPAEYVITCGEDRII